MLNKREHIQSKLSSQGVTIFSVMTELAQRLNALNLSQGFPDFPAPPALLEALSQATLSGYNQYPAGDGVLALREQLAKQFYSEINCNSILSLKLPLPLAQPLRFFVPFKPVSMQMMKSLF